MEFKQCLETRRSIRRYKDQPLSRETIEQIVSLAALSPSWKNTQIARYTVITDRALIDEIAENCVLGFHLNTKTIQGCAALAIQSIVTGRSGYERDGSFTTSLGTHWQSFDAGISAQSFCLAAHELGIGTVIMGIYDEKKLGEAIHLPEGELASAMIAMGYPDEEPKMPPRKDLSVLLRMIE